MRRDLRPLLGAASILAVGWLPVLAHELSGPSNVAALWRTTTTPHARLGPALMVERLAAAVAPPPIFLRSSGRFGFLEDTSAVGVVVAALLFAGVATVGTIVARRTRHRGAARLGALILVATGTSLWLGAGQPSLAAFRADGTRWLWVISLAVWLLLAWAAWQLLADRVADRARAAFVLALGAFAAVLVVVSLGTDRLGDQRDGLVMAAVDHAAALTRRDVPRGTYHFQYEGDQAAVTVGPGVAYLLAADGYGVRVDDNQFNRGYGSRRTRSGAAVAGRIRISSINGAIADRDETLVAETTSPRPGGRPATIRVFLAR